MEPKVKLLIQRAENEIVLSESLLKISGEEKTKEILKIEKERTFYSAVIGHAYYCIFYCAKAYLLSKHVKTSPPDEHKKTYASFSLFVKSKEMDEELGEIYEAELDKADSLLNIFKIERGKRGKFTYEFLPQANKVPAEESVLNANKFFKAVYSLVRGNLNE